MVYYLLSLFLSIVQVLGREETSMRVVSRTMSYDLEDSSVVSNRRVIFISV